MTLSKETLEKRRATYLKNMYKRAESEIGNTYGFLTITGIDRETTEKIRNQGKTYGVYVTCKCKCGSEKSYRLNSIKTEHTYSCGCSKFNNPKRSEDLTGKKFGKLTVIGRDLERDKKLIEEGKSGNSHWLCKCDCGNPELRSVTAYQLKTGHTQSCGCYASEKIAERNKKYSTKINSFRDNEDGTITLFDDNNNECLIDKEDYNIIKRWYWRKVEKRGNIKKGYWATNVKIDDKYNKSVLLIHQVIAEIKYGEYDSKTQLPDHLSRDTSDNRKCNILLKNNMGNCKNRGISKANTSGKTGVSFVESSGKWCAYITVNYKTIHLGSYENIEDAIDARIKAEKKHGFTCDENVADYDKVS